MTIRFEELFAKRLSRIKPGLARVQEANEQLGWISLRTPSIMVAGTNGKGTTSAFLWRLLSLGGLRCGLFTSPHLISFAERIQMSDHPVTESELEKAIPDLVSRIDPRLWEELSFFEASLLLAFRVWLQRGSDLNVLEAGLGGRLDATNISNPDLCVITSIGIDHADYLGNTVSKIAFEKASIIRPGRPVFVGFEVRSQDDAAAMRVIESVAGSRASPLFRLGRDFGVRFDGDSAGTFWFAPLRLEARLPAFFDGAAPYLIENFCVAAAAAIHLRPETATLFDTFSFPEGPWSPVLCGRFHPVEMSIDSGRLAATGAGRELGARDFLFDVCHNPHGARRFVEALDREFGSDAMLPGLVSILNDKDIGGILDVLSGKLHPIVLFRISNDRGLKQDSVPGPYRELPIAGDFAEAVRMLAAITKETPWVVCGSVMAVGEVLGTFADTGSGKARQEPGRHRGPREVALARALALCLRVRDRHASAPGANDTTGVSPV